MTFTVSSPSPSLARRSAVTGRASGVAPRGDRSLCQDERAPLGRYTDLKGRSRELISLPGAAASTLVVDRDAITLGDRRLVAHLAADEPLQNAALVCAHYLQDAAGHWCRHVEPEDLEVTPVVEGEEEAMTKLEPDLRAMSSGAGLLDGKGRSHRLELQCTGMSIPELRWCRLSPDADRCLPEPVSVRHVIACLESYEPVRTLTLRALASHRDDPEVSVTALRAELERVDASRIVLNRGLRRAVLAAVDSQGLSMSEIAVRCGRVKLDSRGNVSGETSWLARRLGILPEGGESAPTPWVHSEVLALIARHGLGISPREVEL